MVWPDLRGVWGGQGQVLGRAEADEFKTPVATKPHRGVCRLSKRVFIQHLHAPHCAHHLIRVTIPEVRLPEPQEGALGPRTLPEGDLRKPAIPVSPHCPLQPPVAFWPCSQAHSPEAAHGIQVGR